VLLEHEVKGRSQFRLKDQLIPDGLIETNQKDKEFNIALELEITRKSKKRITEKFERYINDTKFDSVFWFFTSPGVKKSYIKHFEYLNNKSVKKFIYFEIKEPRFHMFQEELEIEYLNKSKSFIDLEKILGRRMVCQTPAISLPNVARLV